MKQFSLKVKSELKSQSIPDVLGVDCLYVAHMQMEVSYKNAAPFKWSEFITTPIFEKVNTDDYEQLFIHWLVAAMLSKNVYRLEVSDYVELKYNTLLEFSNSFKEYLNSVNKEGEN